MTAKASYRLILPLFNRRPDLREKFQSKVLKLGADECWPWLGSADRHGYGQFRVGARTLIASRTAAALAIGEPGEALVCHTCDNPRCCNPAHLWLGTGRENAADRDAKGRRAPMPTTAKLCPEEVGAIRASARTQRELARQFGVSKSAIAHIKSGTTWAESVAKAPHNEAA